MLLVRAMTCSLGKKIMSSKTYGLTFLKFFTEQDTSEGYFKKSVTAPEDQG